jgi:hypothetical protein
VGKGNGPAILDPAAGIAAAASAASSEGDHLDLSWTDPEGCAMCARAVWMVLVS